MTMTPDLILRWVMDNVSLLILVIIVVLLGIFELVRKLRGKAEAVSDKLYFAAILAGLIPILVGLGQLTVALRDRPKTEIVEVQTLLDLLYTPLKAQYGRGNPYVEDRISSTLEKIKNQLKDRRLETDAIDMTRQELERGILLADKESIVLGIDYGFIPWTKDFSTYQRLNEDKAKEITIKRVFIVPPQILADDGCLTDLLSTMKKQQQNGIKVKIALKSILETKYSDKYKFRRGMVMFSYKNGKHAVIIEETGDLNPNGCYFPQYAVQVLWADDAIAFVERKKQIDWIWSNGPKDAVCDFDPSLHAGLVKQKMNPCDAT